MIPSLSTPHGALPLPAFLPDATRGVVKTLDSGDLAATGIRAIMVNALHLSHAPGASVVESLGGVHRFMGWDGPVVSDSGGYQALSLVAQSSSLGRVTDEGLWYRFDKREDKKLLTPEKCVERQLQLGSDVIIALDECTHPKAPAETQRDSVRRTLEWAGRSKAELDRMALNGRRPRLFAVVQGGDDLALRRECADGLLGIGFDGFGFGGWPVGDGGALLESVSAVAAMLPKDAPKLALGVGRPDNVVAAWRAGYRIFDCTLPTRDGRHGRLYVFRGPATVAAVTGPSFYDTLDLSDERFVRDAAPPEPGCDCACCKRYTRAYLHHLLAVGDATGARLATIHNLRFFARFFELLGAAA
ncbi:MAG: tRNA guanosine(34) transglycosylase Tgt [Candidatus Coatesbacteria bacterium]